MITEWLNWMNTRLLGPAMAILLLGAGVFLMIRLRFFYLRHPGRCMRALLTPSQTDGTSPFRAVTMALAGTLGVGNIVGVAAAIGSGGAGAIFWMWVSAFAAMVVKYGEIVLAVRFRRRESVGGETRFCGGAMYYLRDGLGGGRGAVFLGGLFAVLCVINSITTGNILQANAVAVSLGEIAGFSPLCCGLLLAFLAMIVIAGDAKRISNLTVKLIPLLSAVYLAMSLYIIFRHAGALPGIFGRIVTEAFDFRAAGGGILGFLINRGVRLGVTRGVLSNEAGCGTAPTAHAAADARSPADQGLWGIFEVFADTIVLCSVTAFVVLISYDDLVLRAGLDGIALTMRAYEKFGGTFFVALMGISIFFFAYATIICQSYYGVVALRYLSRRRIWVYLYDILYGAATVWGAVMSARFMWAMADLVVGVMTVINTLAVCRMSGQIREETARFCGWSERSKR